MTKHATDLSTYLLQASLLPLQKEMTCPKCKLALRDKVVRLVVEWASVKVMIKCSLVMLTFADILARERSNSTRKMRIPSEVLRSKMSV